MRPDVFILGILGLWYNTNMQSFFGDYRFSHTIQSHFGEPGWLRYFHESHKEFYDAFGFKYKV